MSRMADVFRHIAHNHVDVEICFALHCGDVAYARCDFHIADVALLLVSKFFAVEHAEGHFTHSTKAGDRAESNVLCFANRLNAVENFFPLLDAENNIISINTVFHSDFLSID